MISRFKPDFFLRLGLGLMYVYSGYSLLTQPTSWIQFVPFGFKEFLNNFSGLDLLIKFTNIDPNPVITFVQIQGVLELVIAIIFLFWLSPRWLVKWSAFITAVEMGLILIFGRIDLVTFRDIGLLGAALALWASYSRR